MNHTERKTDERPIGDRTRKLLRAIALAAAVFSVCYAAFSTWETSFYRKALPKEIQTRGFAFAGSSTPILALPLVLVFPQVGFAFREACGAVLHNLEPAAGRAMTAEGLSFFGSAREGRGYQGTRRAHYYAYQPWRETPAGLRPGKNMVALGLDCAGVDAPLTRRISDALMKPGSFYADGPEKSLLVVPSLGLVVMAYFG